MAIAVGDTIPDIRVMTSGPEGPTHVQTAEVLGSGKVVLFAVPGAFTPTCSDYHLPSYVIRHDELVAKGVDTVACISVNDPFVMAAWGEDQQVGDAVTPAGRRQRRVHRGRRPRDGWQRLRTRHPVAALRHGPPGRGGDRPPRRAGRRPHRQRRRRRPRGALTGYQQPCGVDHRTGPAGS